MHRIPYSETTRKRAIEAFNSLDTDKLLGAISTTPVDSYFMKSIEKSIAKDKAAMESWMPKVNETPERTMRFNGPSDEQKLLNLLSREREPVPKYGKIGADRISAEQNHATEIVAGSAKKQGDTLRVAKPELFYKENKAKKDDAELSSPDEGSSNDVGGFSAYGG